MTLQGSNSKEIQERSVSAFYCDRVNKVVVSLERYDKAVANQFEYYSYYKCPQDEAQIDFLNKNAFIIDCVDIKQANSIVELLGIETVKDKLIYKIDRESSKKFPGILVTLLEDGVAIELDKKILEEMKNVRQTRTLANLAESPQINYCRSLSRKDCAKNIAELINVPKLKESEFDLIRVLQGNSFDHLIEIANEMRHLCQVQASETVLANRFNIFKEVIADFKPLTTKAEFLRKLREVKKEINFDVKLDNLFKILGIEIRLPKKTMPVLVNKEECPGILRNVFFEMISVDK